MIFSYLWLLDLDEEEEVFFYIYVYGCILHIKYGTMSWISIYSNITYLPCRLIMEVYIRI
jgi:hypothetical protein